ncbi:MULTISPECIES: hypothetical protein [unclassified Granulicatella]|uniref:hypothetical protein n=1 Tax=unclassified Granulicatella TaxID=2630493 RepID=UPI00107445C8|nr:MULTISPECIES: hypothetical protein [unclassified Granulicatella]MBF0779792.1 hypothetical protein [Granulicatella sp. 19428wC4_WM01]TFU96194.1 hypothetical protein E4T68_01670 [Granulicatella sp. WM01]
MRNVKKDWRYHNTELLLSKYRLLKKHCQTIVEDLEIYEDSVYNLEELTLHALMKHKVKTAKMLDYFENALESYRILCVKTETGKRRFNIVYHLYISGIQMSQKEIAEYYNIDRTTIFRNRRKFIHDLSFVLWGLDECSTNNSLNVFIG